jgi:hypothetical protein
VFYRGKSPKLPLKVIVFQSLVELNQKSNLFMEYISVDEAAEETGYAPVYTRVLGQKAAQVIQKWFAFW